MKTEEQHENGSTTCEKRTTTRETVYRFEKLLKIIEEWFEERLKNRNMICKPNIENIYTIRCSSNYLY